MDPTKFMQQALVEAEKAQTDGEVPIGAVVVVNDEIISRAHNKIEQLNDATAHAEVLALRQAAEKLGDWRLNTAQLYVTLEPCPMCIGACLLSRIEKLFFGSYDPRQGAVGSCFDLSQHPELPHQIEVFSGVMADQSRSLLDEFFRELRDR